jgi:acyl carrier protein
MMDRQEIEDKVRAYVLEAFLADADAAAFSNDDDLLKILDSLQILRMVIAVEGLFAIKVKDAELTAENLGSVRRVAALVARKQDELRQPSPDAGPVGPGGAGAAGPPAAAGGETDGRAPRAAGVAD